MTMKTDVLDGRGEDRDRGELGDDRAGVVLHEEQLKAGVERVESGRVEVRKRIVVEELTVTVPVRREVIDVVRVYADGSEEPLDVPADTWEPRVDDRTGHEHFGHTHADGGGAGPGEVYDAEVDGPIRPAASSESGRHALEVVLHEERPVVTAEVYAVERIRLDVVGTRTSEAVTAEVRREVADLETIREPQDGGPGRR